MKYLLRKAIEDPKENTLTILEQFGICPKCSQAELSRRTDITEHSESKDKDKRKATETKDLRKEIKV